MTKEFKTGVVVIAAATFFSGMLLAVSTVKLFEPTYLLPVQFSFTGGLELHAPVRLAGVLVGEVKGIELQTGDDTKAIAWLRLKRSAQVRGDAEVHVGTLGLLGEKYVEIVQGTAQSPFARPGEMLVGQDPFQMDELVETAQAIAQKLELALADIRTLTQNVNTVVEGNQPDVDEILENLKLSSANFRDFSEDIKRHPWKILIRSKEKGKEQGKEKPSAPSRQGTSSSPISR